MNNLDSNALRVLADLLNMADNEFSNHGCNDYELPDTPENSALLEMANRWNAPNGPADEWELHRYDGKLLVNDYFLMAFFAHLCRNLADEMDK